MYALHGFDLPVHLLAERHLSKCAARVVGVGLCSNKAQTHALFLRARDTLVFSMQDVKVIFALQQCCGFEWRLNHECSVL